MSGINPDELSRFEIFLERMRYWGFYKRAEGGISGNWWTALFNSQWGKFQGRKMISAPEAFRLAENASPQELGDFREKCLYNLMTSTHITYMLQNLHKPLAGIVIHDYKSDIARPKAILLDEIPVLPVPVFPARTPMASVREVAETAGGLLFLRALADDAYATPAKLFEQLAALTGKAAEEIFMATPDLASRREFPERGVYFQDEDPRFGEGDNRFITGGDDFWDDPYKNIGVTYSVPLKRQTPCKEECAHECCLPAKVCG